MKNSKGLSDIEIWLEDDELKELYSAAYWNDLEEEKKKAWWIADGDYDKLWKYLESSGLWKEWRMVERYICEMGGNDLHVADLAAGIGWCSALISKLENVAMVHAVEISKHRLTTLFEHAISMFNGNPQKIHRYLGSFYSLKFADSSIDIIFLSQAFHHANHPLRLLSEMNRVLRGGGRIILMGEHYVSLCAKLRRLIKKLVYQKRLSLNFYELFPPDSSSGDHYYRVSDYYLFFQLLGYRVKHEIVDKSILVVADKCT